MIKAPYNFVPLAKDVVFPEWASEISIDRPFEDGVSGIIKVKYIAQTPVFIGNGKSVDKKTDNYKAANGMYAIPGSSLRGMLRNVIEIASFGKFNRVTNDTLSVRDLNNRSLYSSKLTKTKGKNEYEALAKGGWLCFDDKNKIWVLYPVTYHRIEDSDIEQFYKLEKYFLEGGKPFNFRIKPIGEKKIYFHAENVKPHEHHRGMKLHYSKVDKISKDAFPGSEIGYTVITGQPGRRFNQRENRKIGKHMDFIFEEKTSLSISLDKSIILQFKQANESNSANQKEGFEVTKKLRDYTRMGYPGIPVFYLADSDGNPESLGLSQMYRLPYKTSLHEAIKNSSEKNFSENLDFAECIFGKIKNTKDKTESKQNFSLRGRIQFEDAVSKNATLDKTVNTVLENPKPTYYPNYIKQNPGKENYKTLMDDDVELRGWKRYPVRNEVKTSISGEDQEKVASHFTPLSKDTVFEGTIHFHNLKKEELGALLWAITWGGDSNLSHAVGMGKPLGLGQIKTEITSLEYLLNSSNNNDYKNATAEEEKVWMEAFISYMERKINNWKLSAQLKELLAMANPQKAKRTGWDLTHLSLRDENKRNQFVDAKKSYSFLAPYSENKQEKHLAYEQKADNSNWQNKGNGKWRTH